MPDYVDADEARRLERIHALLQKDFADDQGTFRVQALIGGTFEVAVRDLPAPALRATVLAVDSGMVLLRYADAEQSRYWVPLGGLQWLKVVT